MKTIFLFLLSTTLFMSCNNSNPDTKKNEVTKDEKNITTETKKGWSDDDKKRFTDDCVGDASHDACSCYLEKAQAMFSSYEEFKKNAESSDDYRKAMSDCRAKFSNSSSDTKKDEVTKDEKINNTDTK